MIFKRNRSWLCCGSALLLILSLTISIPSIAFAAGTGSFVPHPTTPSFGADNSADVALGDLNGDGNLDAVVANRMTFAFETVWLSDGLGNFSAHPTTPSFNSNDSTAVELGDWMQTVIWMPLSQISEPKPFGSTTAWVTSRHIRTRLPLVEAAILSR